MRIEDHAGAEPKLDPFEFFEGRTRAWGLFEDRFGRVRRQFTVDIAGRREGAAGFVLEEEFTYADGAAERRVWRIARIAPGRYEGRADDVAGAARGVAAGNALHWRYTLMLPIGAQRWAIDFDDWMFLQPGGVLMNRARVSKWGFAVGTVTLAFRRGAEELVAARAVAA